jgi:hypothetical protein
LIEVRKSLLAPFCEANVRAARRLYGHCPDCGGHTRMMVVHAQMLEDGTRSGPPPAQIFFCDRCALALLVVYDPSQRIALEQGLPELLKEAGILVPTLYTGDNV